MQTLKRASMMICAFTTFICGISAMALTDVELKTCAKAEITKVNAVIDGPSLIRLQGALIVNALDLDSQIAYLNSLPAKMTEAGENAKKQHPEAAAQIDAQIKDLLAKNAADLAQLTATKAQVTGAKSCDEVSAIYVKSNDENLRDLMNQQDRSSVSNLLTYTTLMPETDYNGTEESFRNLADSLQLPAVAKTLKYKNHLVRTMLVGVYSIKLQDDSSEVPSGPALLGPNYASITADQLEAMLLQARKNKIIQALTTATN